mgnify:CR=1 FL=1
MVALKTVLVVTVGGGNKHHCCTLTFRTGTVFGLFFSWTVRAVAEGNSEEFEQ